MKKLTGMFLLLFAVSAMFAAPVFRADVTGTRKDGKVKIEPVQGTNMNATVPGFRSEADRPYCVNAYTKTPLKKGEWTECAFSFKADGDGVVQVELGGQWAKDTAMREWILIGPVAVNGEMLSNSDYSQTHKDSKGKVHPNGYWLSGKSELKADAGPDGKGAVRANHDNRLSRRLKVEAGKTYTVSAKVMPAE